MLNAIVYLKPRSYCTTFVTVLCSVLELIRCISFSFRAAQSFSRGGRTNECRLMASTSHLMPSSTPSPVSAETGIVRQSRRPISAPACWNTGLISRTPITSGRSCLLASIRSGTPDSSSFLIILSGKAKGCSATV